MENIESIIQVHKTIILDYFISDKSFDYIDSKNDNNTYLYYLIGTDNQIDSTSEKSNNGNLYVRLYEHKAENIVHDDLLFLRINKEGLHRMLVERKHVKRIIDEYMDKFMSIGSLGTGLFYSINDIIVNYRQVILDNRTVEYVVEGWIRYHVFRDFTILSFCEQALYIAILYRNSGSILRWALLHPISSKLIKSNNAIGLYGIQGVFGGKKRII